MCTCSYVLSHLPVFTAGFGTSHVLVFTQEIYRLPKLHRAGPSASLDKSALAIQLVG